MAESVEGLLCQVELVVIFDEKSQAVSFTIFLHHGGDLVDWLFEHFVGAVVHLIVIVVVVFFLRFVAVEAHLLEWVLVLEAHVNGDEAERDIVWLQLSR